MKKDEIYKHYEYKYRNHPDKKKILLKIQRQLFKKEILQPFEKGFKENYLKSWKMRERMDEQIDKENLRKKKDLDKVLKEKGNKRVLTKEQITLRELQREHPTIYEEEKILTWPN